MFEEALSLLSIWASMNSWLTPAVLFLLLNLMIGTIAVTSGFSSSPKPPSHHPDTHHQHYFHHHLHQQQPPQIQTQLTRNPSVLQRLKSLNFYAYIHTPPPPSQQFHSSPPPQQPPPTTAEQFPEIHTHFPPPPTSSPPPPPSPPPSPPPQTEEAESDPEPEVDSNDGEGPTLDEVYRLFVQKGNSPHYNRQNSDTKPAGGEIPAKLPTKIKKSASHKSAFSHFKAAPKTPRKAAPLAVAEEEDAAVSGGGRGGEEVDARADDFINKFRQQLKMQRHDSILRYKDMITRGSAK